MTNQVEAITTPALSAEEVEFVRSYLAETREEFIQAFTGLTEGGWKFKRNSECWSPEQIAEHHILTERAIQGLLSRIADAPAPAPEWNPAEIDQFIPVRVPDRSQKGKSPDFLQPAGRWRGEEVLREFVSARQGTMEFLNSPHLRGHVIPHPFFGPWDGYQWLLAIGAHGRRHTAQLIELRSDPEFPR